MKIEKFLEILEFLMFNKFLTTLMASEEEPYAPAHTYSLRRVQCGCQNRDN